jgi:DNA-binding MarR family transcriptional regulator
MTQELRRVRWLNDLVRLEILLWERVDARLRRDNRLTLGQFEAMFVLVSSGTDTLRVGDLAQGLSITVGGASKLADRVVAAGLMRREPDPDDRRASRLAMTELGREAYASGAATYEACVAELLDPELTPEEQETMHTLARRLLNRLKP